MALRTLRTNLSGLFKTKGTELVETPQLYLKLTTKCTKKVDGMVSFRVSSSPKFNREQCQYLVDKLKMAVQSAQSFLELNNAWFSTFALDQDMVRSLEVFKLLFALAKGVESFIQGCCKDTWIQSAILLANVSEYISSLGFNLELCTIVFSRKEIFATLPSSAVARIVSESTVEAIIIKEKADLDNIRLNKDVIALIQSSKSGSAEWQLGTFLLERLESRSQLPGPAVPVSNLSSHSKILFKNLEQLEMLGRGAFGTVHKARWFGAEVAKKAFHGHGKCMSDFLQEVSILGGLRHSNIVSLLWYATDLRKCYMIVELMDGDLFSLMEKRMEEGGFHGSPFSMSEALDIMLQVGAGMLFLHEKKIVHRDLKSHNILVKYVKAREVNAMYLHVKVADFGLAQTKEKSMTYSDQTQNQGSSRWMAPEMIKNRNYGESFQSQVKLNYPFKCDIYSFAMVCCEILTGNVPFPSLNPTEVKKKVLAGHRPQLPSECPARLRTLIEACWSPEPSKRPCFGDICAEIRHMKCEHLMECWSQMHGKNEGEAGPGRLVKFERSLQFTGDDLLCATAEVLGKSTFGILYKVMLENGSYIAVKLLREGIVKSMKDFTKELDVLGKVRHPNLLALRAFYWGPKDEKLLAYDYMPGGSLAAFLHAREPETASLDWATRIRIAEGAARGLVHLHQNESIVYGILTASNILLDTRGPGITACISDFGLSRLMTRAANANVVVTTEALGYRAPELTMLKEATTMSDVYSFGIVLLELLTGKEPQDRSSLDGALHLPCYVRNIVKENRTGEVFDVGLMTGSDAPSEEELVTALDIAMQCVSRFPSDRPEMDAIIRALEEIHSEERFQSRRVVAFEGRTSA